jgi:hypothetical protein
MALEQHARRSGLVLLREREGVQQVMGHGGDVALGKALQEHQRPIRVLVEHRRGGGEIEDHGVAGIGAQRLFRQRQKAAPAFPVRKGIEEDRIPPAGIVQQVADGQLQLRGRRRGHDEIAPSGPTRPAGEGESHAQGYRCMRSDQDFADRLCRSSSRRCGRRARCSIRRHAGRGRPERRRLSR